MSNVIKRNHQEAQTESEPNVLGRQNILSAEIYLVLINGVQRFVQNFEKNFSDTATVR